MRNSFRAAIRSEVATVQSIIPKTETRNLMKFQTTMVAAAAMLMGAGTASASIAVTAGDIYAVDPSAVDYGAVRFKDFTNGSDGGRGGNLYLQNNSSGLGSGTGSDSRARVDGNPLWNVNSANNFKFEYRPVAGGTDLILAGATDRMTPGFQRVIDDPAKTVNYISFYIQSNEGTAATADSIILNLTDLDGQSLSPGSISFSSTVLGGGINKFYLTDPTLLANGFILTGNIQMSGTVERGESDKVQIAFGNMTPVPEPSTYVAGALLALPVLLNGMRVLRRRQQS